MKDFNILIIIVIALFLSSFVTVVKAQPYYDASFTKIMVTDGNGSSDLLYGGTAKVYEGQTTWMNLTFHNTNCGMPWGYLYTRIYEDNVPIHTSNERIVWLGTDSQDTWSLTASGGPTLRTYKVEVWWESSGTHYLEDEKTFSVQVVRLFVTEWSPSSLSVEKGKTSTSTWSINFKNGGNDMIYSASISIIDSGGLQISPSSNNLGDIASQGTKATSFSVTAPNTLSTGFKTVSFQASYNDFEGNSHLESKTGSVTVNKLGTTITPTLTPSAVKKDGSTTITAKLLDGNGNPIASQAITFSVGGTSLGSANTDSSGNAVKQYTANVNAGTYAIVASYEGTSNYDSSSATSNLLISALDSTLNITALSVKAGANATITATLKDENENPISSASIDFYLFQNNQWSKINSTTTNAVGKASITRAFSTSGEYQIKTVYAGDINYNGVNATATLTISKFTTALAIDVPSATQGKECTIKATLKDENGNPMENMNVEFDIYEANMWTKIGVPQTDSNGISSLVYTPSSIGSFQVKAVFTGATNYASSESTSTSLNVVMDYTPYYVGGGIIAVIVLGAVGYLVFRRMRRKTTPQK